MKIIFFFLVMLPLLVISQNEQTSIIDVYSRFYPDGKIDPVLNISGLTQYKSRFGATYFCDFEKNRSNVVLGVSYLLNKSSRVNLGIGMKEGPNLIIMRAGYFFKKRKISLSFLGEGGLGSNNYWYKFLFDYKTSKCLMLGISVWRYNGFGPIITYSPNRSIFSFWVFPTYDLESKDKRLILGITLKFKGN